MSAQPAEPVTPEFCCNERSDNGLCWSTPDKPCSWAKQDAWRKHVAAQGRPAEPVIVGTGNTRILVEPVEPVAWLIPSSTPGKPGVLLHAKNVTRFGSGGAESEFTLYETPWIPLYDIPDPRIAALEAERDEARAEAAALRGAIDTVMAIPSMTDAQLEELKRNCRAAIKARKEKV